VVHDHDPDAPRRLLGHEQAAVGQERRIAGEVEPVATSWSSKCAGTV
jgi:hypothetical protein